MLANDLTRGYGIPFKTDSEWKLKDCFCYSLAWHCRYELPSVKRFAGVGKIWWCEGFVRILKKSSISDVFRQLLFITQITRKDVETSVPESSGFLSGFDNVRCTCTSGS